MVIGGQERDFEDKICVSIEIAKDVAKKYYALGEIDEKI